MKKTVLLSLASLSLALCTPAAYSQQNPPHNQNRPANMSKDVPQELQEARQKLESAKADLQRAGSDWGGYRVKAIEDVNQALENLNRATEYRQKEMKH